MHALIYIFLHGQRKLFAVDVKANASALEAGVPKELFETRYVNLVHTIGGNYHTFAVAPDGRRFLILRQATPSSDEAPPSPIAVVLNWTAGIKGR